MTARLVKRAEVQAHSEAKPVQRVVAKTPEQIRREWQAERAVRQSSDALLLAKLRSERKQGR